MIYIGADHGGYHLKEAIKQHLERLGIPYQDLGSYSPDHVDYPDYAFAVADYVAAEGGQSRGILTCTTSVGVCMAANKVAGIRGVVGYSETAVRRARNDEDSNILCLAGQETDIDQALALVDLFLATPFSNAERHVRRLGKIAARESHKRAA